VVKSVKYLVTGGAGFIGSNLVDYLLTTQPDAHVTVLDKLTYAGSRDNLKQARATGRLTFMLGDICDEDKALKACKKADVVIHAAAESHVDRSILSGEEAARTNFLGTFVTLEAARRAGVSKFLFVSTDEVYGSKPRGTFDEDSPLNPRNPYSAAKAGADRMAQAFFVTYGLPVVITRPSNNYGPRQFPEKLVPFFVSRALRDQPLPVYGDGQQRRDWLHVADHCRAMGTVLQKGQPGQAYNIPGGNERRNLQTIRVILDELGKPESLIHFVADRPGHDPRYPLKGSKIAGLGWEPEVEWEQGLRETVRWYVDNQDWLRKSLVRGEQFHKQWYATRP
jgi:dTDP-glucose 4,6-dehydratase